MRKSIFGQTFAVTIGCIFMVGVMGCREDDSSDADHGSGNDLHQPSHTGDTQPASEPVAPPQPTPVTITVHSGVDFDCFALNNPNGGGDVWCRGGTIGNADDVEFNFANFTRIAHHDVAITGIKVWMRTICYEAYVSERPITRTPGIATYCRGRGENSGILDYVVELPTHTDLPLQYGSSDLDWFTAPFTIGEYPINQFMGGGGLMIDGDDGTSSNDLSCSTLDGILTCPDFQIDMN